MSEVPLWSEAQNLVVEEIAARKREHDELLVPDPHGAPDGELAEPFGPARFGARQTLCD